MFYLRAVLHEDSVFRSSQQSLTGLDVAWDGCSASPAVSMQCARLPVIVTHCCFPLSLCLRSKRMRCHGFTRMRMGMWGVSMVRITGTPRYTTWLEKNNPLCCILWDHQVPKVNHESMFNLQQEGILHRASGMTVKHPHSFVIMTDFLMFFDLQEQSSQENKDVVSTFLVHFIWPAKMSYWFAQQYRW